MFLKGAFYFLFFFFFCRYHGDNNIPAMMAIVVPLHEELERGDSTAKEQSFQV